MCKKSKSGPAIYDAFDVNDPDMVFKTGAIMDVIADVVDYLDHHGNERTAIVIRDGAGFMVDPNAMAKGSVRSSRNDPGCYGMDSRRMLRDILSGKIKITGFSTKV